MAASAAAAQAASAMAARSASSTPDGKPFSFTAGQSSSNGSKSGGSSRAASDAGAASSASQLVKLLKGKADALQKSNAVQALQAAIRKDQAAGRGDSLNACVPCTTRCVTSPVPLVGAARLRQHSTPTHSLVAALRVG